MFGFLQQIRDGDAVEIVVDHRIQLAPHRQGAALGHAAALHGVLLQAGHRGQAALAQAQDAADGVLLGRFGQTVAAGLAAQTGQEIRPDKELDDTFKILFRYVLPLGDRPQRDIPVGLMLREVDHDPQGIASFGGNQHFGSLLYA